MSAEYAFRVTGRLTPGVLGALEPLETTAETTETTLVGRLTDRAALHGLIARIEALGLELVGLQQLPPRRPADRGGDRCCAACGQAGARDEPVTPRADSASWS